MDFIRICDLKLWLVELILHVITALHLHRCSARRLLQDDVTHNSEVAPIKYFYAHNETRIAMAMAQAEADDNNGASGAATSVILGLTATTKFPDLIQSKLDGCNWDIHMVSDFGVRNGQTWDLHYGSINRSDVTIDEIDVMVVDSCTMDPDVYLVNHFFEISSERWPTLNNIVRDDVISADHQRFFIVSSRYMR